MEKQVAIYKSGRVIYAHLSVVSCQVGQAVRPGDFIGRSGNTGNSTGAHLHYEIRLDGQENNGFNGAVDPLLYMGENPFLDRMFPMTQGFSENPDAYKRFNLAGHTGVDYGCPEETLLYASHPGKITKIGFDAEGYGNYIRITTDYIRITTAETAVIPSVPPVVQDTSIPLLGEVEEWYSKQVAYSVTSDIGLNVRALPSTDSEVVFRMVDGQKLNAITEHTDDAGNHWLGFVVWCCQEYQGEELARKV